MGMFDYVTHEGVQYQTKDTPMQWLHEYRIENGRLVTHEGHIEAVPKNERPYPEADGLRGLFGSVRFVVDRHNVDQEWHGYLYLIAPNGDEFRAKFTDGNLVQFDRVSGAALCEGDK